MLDTKIFLAAIEQLETENGIAREITIEALKEAFASIFKKKGYEEVRVEVDIFPEAGEINIYEVKAIVDDVEDDALQISLEDALEINPEAKVGEDLRIKNEIDDFSKADAIKFKSILKQKIKEAEKAAIYATYADKEGELITGVVEKVEDRCVVVNIGRTIVTLPKNQLIGDETFQMGQTIRVYLSTVDSSTKGPSIKVSRSEPGFLKRLFEEEIPEIYDGTVSIQGVARRAGERSKVSVTTDDLTVDPIGACIGQAGTKIQKICQQLGKEKIDIVQYHEYSGSFIAEALKPAQVLGVKLDAENQQAIAVVKNDDLRVAIGKKGINVSLAVELTKWKIDIKELDVALAEGIEYETIEAMNAKDQSLLFAKRQEKLLQQRAKKAEEAALVATEVEEEFDDEFSVEPEETIEEVETVEEVVAPAVEETPVEAVEEVEETPVEEVKVEYNPVRMQKGFSLSDLEKQIEEEKKKKTAQPTFKKKFKKDEEKEEKEEEKEVAPVKAEPKNYMPIYTEEEEEEFEDFEEEEYEDDDRFDEYDSDEYYEND